MLTQTKAPPSTTPKSPASGLPAPPAPARRVTFAPQVETAAPPPPPPTPPAAAAPKNGRFPTSPTVHPVHMKVSTNPIPGSKQAWGAMMNRVAPVTAKVSVPAFIKDVVKPILAKAESLAGKIFAGRVAYHLKEALFGPFVDSVRLTAALQSDPFAVPVHAWREYAPDAREDAWGGEAKREPALSKRDLISDIVRHWETRFPTFASLTEVLDGILRWVAETEPFSAVLTAPPRDAAKSSPAVAFDRFVLLHRDLARAKVVNPEAETTRASAAGVTIYNATQAGFRTLGVTPYCAVLTLGSIHGYTDEDLRASAQDLAQAAASEERRALRVALAEQATAMLEAHDQRPHPGGPPEAKADRRNTIAALRKSVQSSRKALAAFDHAATRDEKGAVACFPRVAALLGLSKPGHALYVFARAFLDANPLLDHVMSEARGAFVDAVRVAAAEASTRPMALALNPATAFVDSAEVRKPEVGFFAASLAWVRGGGDGLVVVLPRDATTAVPPPKPGVETSKRVVALSGRALPYFVHDAWATYLETGNPGDLQPITGWLVTHHHRPALERAAALHNALARGEVTAVPKDPGFLLAASKATMAKMRGYRAPRRLSPGTEA